IDSFRMLAETGSVEFLSETYYHSLSFLAGRHEFETQVTQHSEIMEQMLGVRPTVFRNTELIYADNLGRILEDMGFKGTLLDGAETTIGSRNPNQLYEGYGAPNLKLLLRNYRLSDDIAFRYANSKWSEWPLTAAKYVNWLEKLPASDKVVTIGMDYETFGEHHPARTGIFRFLEELLRRLEESRKLTMATPSEIFARMKPVTYLPVPHYSSWADNERDLSAWLGNDIQKDAFESLLGLQKLVYESKSSELLHQWRLLQASDHFYYMSTKRFSDGMVHAHFSPYASPYEAFMNYMNVITDLRLKLERSPKPADKAAEPARQPVKAGRKHRTERSRATV
ncbi:MAG: alpha-amylase, partial [Bacteroidetes bacterium]|nr:alpha-amylase [Bacteroidota bacterium]